MPPREPKIQRWTDLIAALLRRHYPATFEDIARDVPGYGGSRKKDALMRMFERDKDELRSFGIAIATIEFEDENGDASGYSLDRKGFYLPYLSLAAREGRAPTTKRRPDKYGYRALASLIVEPDELAIIVEAAARARALGDPVVAEDAESALRKLSFDLPVSDMAERLSESVTHMAAIATGADTFEVLTDALRRLKWVRFDYHSMGADRITRRDVEPYGLFFLSSNWYLAGRDTDKGEMRNFRLNRIGTLELNTSRSQTADYAIPVDFDLREHARSRQSWELGDGGSDEAIVEFRDPAGAARAAARLGVAVEGAGDQRRFQFRRLDAFARWLLSFGGEAIPTQPPRLVDEFERQARETIAIYEGAQ